MSSSESLDAPTSEPTGTGPTGAHSAELLEVPLLAGLPDDVRELVEAAFVPVHYTFGESIIAEGDAADGFYVIASGVARAIGHGEDGKEVALGVLRPGDSFGEDGLLEGAPRGEPCGRQATWRCCASTARSLTRSFA